jgi:hypothetical protein
MPPSTTASLTADAECEEVPRHCEGPAAAAKHEEEPRALRREGSARPLSTTASQAAGDELEEEARHTAVS